MSNQLPLTEQEILKIVNGFLLSAPPGEFMEVVSDVRGLLNNDALLNNSAPKTFRQYNIDQMLQVKSPGGQHEALITKFNEVGQGEFVDPRGNCVIRFDHIRQQVSGQRPIANGEVDSSIESHRRALDDALANYSQQHFGPGSSAVFSSSQNGNTVLTACVSSSRFSPQNFYNGRWRSVWTATFRGSGQIQLQGSVRVHVHYYEDGNVQVTTSWTKSFNVAGSSDARAVAEAIVKQISKAEQDYHTALEHNYTTMSDTTFKALRRNLPITRSKIDWQKIRNYRVGNDAARQ